MPTGLGDHGLIVALFGEASLRATRNGHTIEGSVMSADNAYGRCTRCGCEILVRHECRESGPLKVIKDCPPTCGPVGW
jgi:hypothetical protein